jgi:hypothetical protein
MHVIFFVWETGIAPPSYHRGQSTSNKKVKIVSGVRLDPIAHDLLCHLTPFVSPLHSPKTLLWRWPGAFDEENLQPYIGLGRYEHAKAIDSMLWPTEFEYHTYSEEHTQASATIATSPSPRRRNKQKAHLSQPTL